MINAVIAVALIAGAPDGIQVDVGLINRNALPQLKTTKRALPTPAMVKDVELMLKSGMCRFSGQTQIRFDITVPYAVLVKPDGTIGHIVVQETGCEPLESYVGLLVREMSRQGDFAQSAGPHARWYASQLNFNLQ